MKSVKNIKERIKDYYSLANDFLNPLQNIIANYIHGNEELDTIKHINNIKEIIKGYKAENFTITNVNYFEGGYYPNNKDNKEINETSKYNDWAFSIVIEYEGICNCKVNLLVSGGWRGGRENTLIYYFKPYDNKIEIKDVSILKEKLNSLLRQQFISNIIDLTFKEDVYLDYSDDYHTYEIWDKKPSSYGETIADSYRENYTEEMVIHIKNLVKCKKISEYAKNKIDGEEHEITWIEYKL